MATLTVTLTESLALGDGSTDRGTTNIQTITSIDEVAHRIMDVTASYVDIIKVGSVASAGTFKTGGIKYLRITNLDDTVTITLRMQNADSEYFVTLEPEDHFILGNDNMDAHETGATALGTAESLADIDVISAKSSSGTKQIEYFIASVVA